MLLVAATLISIPAAAVAQKGPEISIDPTTTSGGSAITVTGSGWDPSLGPVSVYSSIEDVTGPTPSPPLGPPSPSPSPTPDATGSFSITLVVPFLPPGPYTVVACQDCGNSDGFPLARSSLIVAPAAPTLALSAMSGTAGSGINAVGTGWNPANGPVSIFPDASDVSSPGAALFTGVPDATGTFTASMQAPDTPQDYVFVACQRCGAEPAATQTASFTVVSSQAPPARVTVPDLVGLDTRRAEQLVNALHLTLVIRWQGEGEERGIVGSQSPLPGRRVPQGRRVRVTADRTPVVAPVARPWLPAAIAAAALIVLVAAIATAATRRPRRRRWVRRHIRTDPHPDPAPDIAGRWIGPAPDRAVRLVPHEDHGVQSLEEVGS